MNRVSMTLFKLILGAQTRTREREREREREKERESGSKGAREGGRERRSVGARERARARVKASSNTQEAVRAATISSVSNFTNMKYVTRPREDKMDPMNVTSSSRAKDCVHISCQASQGRLALPGTGWPPVQCAADC